MDLAARFARVASANIASLETLEVGKRYRINHVQRMETQYGPSILVTLQIDATSEGRVFLLKRFAEVFLDSDITLINNGTRTYHFVYRGRSHNGRSFDVALEV